MDKNIVLFQVIFYVAMGFVQIGVYVLIFPIKHVNPFVFLNIVLLYFVLHVIHIEFELINYAYDAVYAEVLFDWIF